MHRKSIERKENINTGISDVRGQPKIRSPRGKSFPALLSRSRDSAKCKNDMLKQLSGHEPNLFCSHQQFGFLEISRLRRTTKAMPTTTC
jgi:hypothetical protein